MKFETILRSIIFVEFCRIQFHSHHCLETNIIFLRIVSNLISYFMAISESGVWSKNIFWLKIVFSKKYYGPNNLTNIFLNHSRGPNETFGWLLWQNRRIFFVFFISKLGTIVKNFINFGRIFFCCWHVKKYFFEIKKKSQELSERSVRLENKIQFGNSKTIRNIAGFPPFLKFSSLLHVWIKHLKIW